MPDGHSLNIVSAPVNYSIILYAYIRGIYTKGSESDNCNNPKYSSLMKEEPKDSLSSGGRLIFVVKRFRPDELVPQSRSLKRPSKSYQTTSDEQRFSFIQKIVRKELTIREAAAAFGIRYSTAKTIMKVYKSEGRFEKKKHRLKKGCRRNLPLVEAVQEHGTGTMAAGILEVLPQPDERRGRGLPDGFWAMHITAHMRESS